MDPRIYRILLRITYYGIAAAFVYQWFKTCFKITIVGDDPPHHYLYINYPLILITIVLIALYTILKYIFRNNRIARSSQDYLIELDSAASEDIDLKVPPGPNGLTESNPNRCILDAAGRPYSTRITHFRAHLLSIARTEFGLPKYTEANILVVRRFLLNYCREHGVRPTHIGNHLIVVVPLVFIPGREDTHLKEVMASPEVLQLFNNYESTYWSWFQGWFHKGRTAVRE